MTFKHGKFEDSATMRSLIKVAEQKGWVTSEPLKKTASESIDLSPTSSLTENVLKLCAGLRQSGMHKYADEVEKNFFNYKRASDIYDVSGEEGKDLVDAAHPDGSHKMEGMEGDAVIETILDQHLKDKEMVEKKPSGKLADAASILRAVKVVLAGPEEDKLAALMDMVRRRAQTIATLTESELTVSWSGFSEGIAQYSQNPTIDNLKKIQNIMSKQTSRLKPGIAFGVSEDTWAKVAPQINSINNAVSQALTIRMQMQEAAGQRLLGDEGVEKKEAPGEGDAKPRTGTDAYPEATKLSSALEKSLGTLRGFKASVNSDPDLKDKPEDKAAATAWIDNKIQQINVIKSQLTGVIGTDESNNIAPSLLITLQKITSEFPAFQKEWIG